MLDEVGSCGSMWEMVGMMWDDGQSDYVGESDSAQCSCQLHCQSIESSAAEECHLRQSKSEDGCPLINNCRRQK